VYRLRIKLASMCVCNNNAVEQLEVTRVEGASQRHVKRREFSVIDTAPVSITSRWPRFLKPLFSFVAPRARNPPMKSRQLASRTFSTSHASISKNDVAAVSKGYLVHVGSASHAFSHRYGPLRAQVSRADSASTERDHDIVGDVEEFARQFRQEDAGQAGTAVPPAFQDASADQGGHEPSFLGRAHMDQDSSDEDTWPCSECGEYRCDAKEAGRRQGQAEVCFRCLLQNRVPSGQVI